MLRVLPYIMQWCQYQTLALLPDHFRHVVSERGVESLERLPPLHRVLLVPRQRRIRALRVPATACQVKDVHLPDEEARAGHLPVHATTQTGTVVDKRWSEVVTFRDTFLALATAQGRPSSRPQNTKTGH